MINKHPMISTMAASPYDLHYLLDVVDCTDYMADGGIMDAYYLVPQYIPVMAKLD